MINSEDDFIPKLKSLIEANIDDSTFSVDTICAELGISRSQLHRIVKEQSNVSITLYVRKVRLEKAKYLLANTALRISEVADRVGINHPQNFSKYFITEFAISPTEYRRLHQALPAEAKFPVPQANPEPPVSLPPPLTTDQAPLILPGKRTAIFPKNINRWTLYGVLLLGILLILSIYLRTYILPATRPVDSIQNSLAVLPLINIGPPNTNPVCEGLMDDIHTGVSLIPHLRVTARSSSDQYRSTQKSIWQISEDLQVANILRGKMLKIGEQIQMKIELINAKENRPIWTKIYTVAYRDMFQLTEQVTQDVARELGLENNRIAPEKLTLARTRNIVAYNNFLQGRQLVITRNKDKVLEGMAKIDQALALDSTFAEAQAFKGLAYSLLANSNYIANPAKAYELAQQHALKAIHFSPTNSTAYGVLGTIYADTYQWKAAEASFLIALQHNPNDAQINYWYSLLLRSTGRLDEAIRYSTKAVALDPLYPVILTGHAVNYVYANRYDLAQASLNSGRALFGDLFIFHVGHGYFYLAKENYQAASTSFSHGLTLNPQYTVIIPTLMYCEAKRGNRAKAVAYLRTLTAKTPRTYYDKAVVFAGLSQKDSCLYYLKTAADRGYIYKDMKVVPLFRDYRTEPVFQAILRQYRLPANP
ncbi:hypothetical protein GCM10023187_09610 [Nibrella viscosa]|uniref:HTH araC/xylS-type domain-containing protein n=1 Tax=Nibrella viscosa TaxID=1084524 RepID=A0ABP8K088_9BACT